VDAALVPARGAGLPGRVCQPEGWFLAHLSAAATIACRPPPTIACLPVLLAGWAVQDELVRGLSMGAVK
jgi:sorbitol/mannitol transport system permease protein